MVENKLNRKQQLKRLLEGVYDGESDLEVKTELEISDARYEALKESALFAEVERVKDISTEQTYVEYCLAQHGCIRDLNKLILQYQRESKNPAALVSAIKARSDIVDKMIKLGQDFGIIEKKPQEQKIVAGVVVTQLSNEELRAAIAKQIASLNSMVNEFGDTKFIDVEPGELYRELPKPKMIEAKLEPEPEPEPPPPEPEPEPELELPRHLSKRVEAPPPEPEPEPEKPPPQMPRHLSRRPVAPPTAPSPSPRQPGLPPRPLHGDKKNRAKSSKVWRGRRVVKPPVR